MKRFCLILALGFLTIPSIYNSAMTQGSFWQQLNGPNFASAKIQTLGRNSNGNIFAGLSRGGVYRSTNNGGNWVQVNTGLTSLVINTLCVDHTDNMFVGTDIGVFRSTNNGSIWTRIGALPSGSWFTCTIDTSGTIFFGGQQSKLYRSTDHGDSWVYIGGDWGNTRSIAINDSGFIFVGAEGAGISLSTDRGAHWVLANNGLPSHWSILPVWKLIINADNTILAGAINLLGDGLGVYRSTNNGGTWVQFNSGLGDQNINLLTFDRSNNPIAGTNLGMYRLREPDSTWLRVGIGLDVPTYSLLQVQPDLNIVGSRNGEMYESTRLDSTWAINHTFLSPPSFYDIAVNQNNGIIASTSAGVFLSTNSGNNWVLIKNNSGKLAISSNGFVYITNGSSIDRSTDNGSNWEQRYNGYSVAGLAANRNGNIFATTNVYCAGGVVRLSDNINGWIECYNGLWTSYEYYLIATDSSGRVYTFPGACTGGGSGFLYRSFDNGGSWTPGANILNGQITALATDLNGYIYAGSNTLGVRRSQDYGNSWANANIGLVNPIITLATNSLNHVYAGTSVGVFRSSNHGNNWSLVDSSFQQAITCLTFDLNGYCYAGTTDYGIIRSVNSTTTDVYTLNSENATTYYISQNYPNPFNPLTIINFSLPHSGHAELKVFNMLGQEVATLVSSFLPAGENRITWNARGITSGAYFYRLQAGNYSETKKLVLTK